ncbi:MAG: hypothetical protein IJ501_06225 [Bacilli bacterium]|nr:hypothetical protein [Bacilli bacterium]
MNRNENKDKENKEGKLLQVRSDILFHDLFNEHDITTLEWVVSKILDCEYNDIKGRVKVHNIRLTRVNKKERSKYVDLIVEYKNEKIVIELNHNFSGIYTRNILYAANILLNNYKIQDDKNLDDDYYKKVIRVLLVNLNWYPGIKGDKIEPKKIYEIPYSDIESSGYLLKIINVNLDYYKNVCYDKVNQLDKFYKLLTIDNKDDLDKVIKKEKILKNYSNKLIDLSSNEKYVEDIMDEIIEENVAKQTAYLLGEQSGIEKGIKEKQNEVVLNMHKNNLSTQMIANCTNLTISEVEEIINNKE